MKNIKFINEPGYIYDLNFCFVYYFNRKHCLTSSVFINYDKNNEDIEFYNGVMYNFSDISADSLLFFYINDIGRSLFSKYYYENHSDSFLLDYNLSFIQRLFRDTQNVIKNVFQYYFPEIEINKIDFDYGSLSPRMGELIDNSKYDAIIKHHLYSFFLNPIRIIDKLNADLIAVNTLLSQYYEKNYKITMECHQKINIEDLQEKLTKIENRKINIDNFENIYVSICLINKNCIKMLPIDGSAFIMLGYDYEDFLLSKISQLEPINLHEVGNALAEKNRIDILNFILNKEEITIRDLEGELNITSTNAYYHINLMLKANLLKARNEGKVVLYSINEQCFVNVIKHLKKYLSIKEWKEESLL